ncbi:nuclear transport factor 2 family protein [Nocardia xishanensis]|uniref:nuclear transport factor 2 family protein n=1 Tax=Nocardia xishanensis TaxID=238964 RepID=UPI000AB09302|nr:nuclear transport factor 2 family protein [Nocardia xishanensis]
MIMSDTKNPNTELVRAVFDRMAGGDMRALGAAMAEDFAWIFPGDWSWAGTWAPKSVVLQQLLGPLMAQFESYRLVADSVLGDGDRVVVQARGHGVTVRGEAYEQTYCMVFRVAEGRLAEVVEYCNTALVERVLEPIGPPPGGARGE